METQEHLQGIEEDLIHIVNRQKYHNSHEERERRLSYENEAMQIWQNHAETYRTIVYEYLFILDERRKAKAYPMHALSKSVITEYPYVEFFHCLDQSLAREYLRRLTLSQLIAMTIQVRDIVNFNHSYRSIVNKVKDLRYWQKCKNSR